MSQGAVVARASVQAMRIPDRGTWIPETIPGSTSVGQELVESYVPGAPGPKTRVVSLTRYDQEVVTG